MPLWRWWLVAIAGLVTARFVQLFCWGSRLYSVTISGSFYVGQTTFNATELKGYYRVMLDKGTPVTVLAPQCIDFVFIACTYWAFCAHAKYFPQH